MVTGSSLLISMQQILRYHSYPQVASNMCCIMQLVPGGSPDPE